MPPSTVNVILRELWEAPAGSGAGEIELGTFGAAISVIQISTEIVGEGPRLHKHPYTEVFIVRRARALYTIGDTTIEAEAGQILIAPPNMPHKFENLGPDRLESTDIHLAGAFETVWLE